MCKGCRLDVNKMWIKEREGLAVLHAVEDVEKVFSFPPFLHTFMRTPFSHRSGFFTSFDVMHSTYDEYDES